MLRSEQEEAVVDYGLRVNLVGSLKAPLDRACAGVECIHKADAVGGRVAHLAEGDAHIDGVAPHTGRGCCKDHVARAWREVGPGSAKGRCIEVPAWATRLRVHGVKGCAVLPGVERRVTLDGGPQDRSRVPLVVPWGGQGPFQLSRSRVEGNEVAPIVPQVNE